MISLSIYLEAQSLRMEIEALAPPVSVGVSAPAGTSIEDSARLKRRALSMAGRGRTTATKLGMDPGAIRTGAIYNNDPIQGLIAEGATLGKIALVKQGLREKVKARYGLDLPSSQWEEAGIEAINSGIEPEIPVQKIRKLIYKGVVFERHLCSKSKWARICRRAHNASLEQK